METKSLKDVLNEEGKLFYATQGVSMLPLIREGRDFVYLEKAEKDNINIYDVVLFQRLNPDNSLSFILHRILKTMPDGSYWIVGDNCMSGDIVKEKDILGVLVALKRKGKTLKLDSLGYKLYVYLWCAPYPIRFFILLIKSKLRSLKRRLIELFT